MDANTFINKMIDNKISFDIGYRKDDKGMFVWVFIDGSDDHGLNDMKNNETKNKFFERVYKKYTI